jgi:hypothetical protein
MERKARREARLATIRPESLVAKCTVIFINWYKKLFSMSRTVGGA